MSDELADSEATVRELTARIAEVEQSIRQAEDRLEHLKARRTALRAAAGEPGPATEPEPAGEREREPAPRQTVLVRLRALADETDGRGVSAERLYEDVTETITREQAESALRDLLRQGEVYEPAEGRVRIT